MQLKKLFSNYQKSTNVLYTFLRLLLLHYIKNIANCKYLFLILQAFFEEIFAKYSKYHIKNHY